MKNVQVSVTEMHEIQTSFAPKNKNPFPHNGRNL